MYYCMGRQTVRLERIETVEMENGNETSEAQENPYLVQQIVLEFFLLVLIIVGNVAVLIVIISEGKRSRMNFYIKNLAVADLLCGVFYVIPRIVFLFNNGFFGGNILCKIQEYLKVKFGIYGSNTIMVAVSIDRLFLLLAPMGSLVARGKRPLVVCILCWLLAAVISISGPIVFSYDGKKKHALLTSTDGLRYGTFPLLLSHMTIYFTIIFVGVFVIPTLIIMGCYFTIAYIIWKVSHSSEGRQESNVLNPPQHSSLSNNSQTDSDFGSTITKAKMKTIKMTFVIAIAFVVCWSPYMIVNILSVYDYKMTTNKFFGIFIGSLLPLNSVVNPLIYAAFSVRVCRQFRSKLRRKLSASRSSRRTENVCL
uniref:Cardioacceleratory peptide receptor-like n=1 Tax=Crassostrea virginica TaxID=6565 RepID=A0A8B8D5S0_CRAVI|nr:cardioacceleratory peptide receptor-like [Crassostrea virginica]